VPSSFLKVVVLLVALRGKTIYLMLYNKSLSESFLLRFIATLNKLPHPVVVLAVVSVVVSVVVSF
jgi:hypothetical protein